MSNELTKSQALPGRRYVARCFKVNTLIDMGPGYHLVHAVSLHNSASEFLAVFEIEPGYPTEVSQAPQPVHQPPPTPVNGPTPPAGPMQSIPLGKRE